MPSARIVARLMTCERDARSDEALRLRVAVETACPTLVAARTILDRFKTMVASGKCGDLDLWLADAAETEILRRLARRFAGAENVVEMARPTMGSEDFAYMLKERPGSYFFLGGGASTSDRPLHHPGYNFNDDMLPIGAAFWVELVEEVLKAG